MAALMQWLLSIFDGYMLLDYGNNLTVKELILSLLAWNTPNKSRKKGGVLVVKKSPRWINKVHNII